MFTHMFTTWFLHFPLAFSSGNQSVVCQQTVYVFFLKEMIDEADRDGDGEINEAEFLRIMKKTSLY